MNRGGTGGVTESLMGEKESISHPGEETSQVV